MFNSFANYTQNATNYTKANLEREHLKYFSPI